MSELTHFGVPGMKWGHRKGPQVGDRIKAPDGQMATVVSHPRRLSRKEVRAVNKAGREQWAKDKADKLLVHAMNDSLIKLAMPGTVPTVVTGKQFVNYVKNQGAFDIYASDVWASKTPYGTAYKMSEPTAGYKKIKR